MRVVLIVIIIPRTMEITYGILYYIELIRGTLNEAESSGIERLSNRYQGM